MIPVEEIGWLLRFALLGFPLGTGLPLKDGVAALGAVIVID